MSYFFLLRKDVNNIGAVGYGDCCGTPPTPLGEGIARRAWRKTDPEGGILHGVL
jgi:hypothetical protein